MYTVNCKQEKKKYKKGMYTVKCKQKKETSKEECIL